MNQWEIIDDKGTIESGTEEDMRYHFNDILYTHLFTETDFEWEGDLRLIEVHAVTR